MTEQECIGWIDYSGNMKIAYDRSLNKRRIACDMAIKALEEIQQYRALGTVEELRVARDKQIPKMPKIWANGTKHCPNEDCEEVIYTSDNYCLKCGQKLNWEEV